MQMNNKKGSISVYLVFILTAVIGVTAVFIYAAKQKAYVGISDGSLNLAMRSILSEYDLTLFERYGILAFEKNGLETALKVNDYLDYAFKGNSPVTNTEISFGEYSMNNVNTLKKQILEYMKINGIKNIITEKNDNTERKQWEDRTLRNQGVINSLPSKPFINSGDSFLDRIERLKEQLGSVEDILSETTESYMVDKYILDRFKYATGGPLDEASFFQHEVEYIIAGSYSNAANREKVEAGLRILRTAMNTAYLYSDEKRYAQTLAAAELLTPAAAPATQAILITTWATVEAGNDVKLLLKGKPVPVMKTDMSWATSLDNVINNISEEFIDTGNEKGLFYDDYLMIFLHFQNESIKLARVADLIQVNMKATQDRDFLMSTCSEGLYLNTQIYGKEYSYETCY